MPDFKPAPVKPVVSKADVDKLDVRVGTITSVEDVPGAKKLVRLRVDFGDHTRAILRDKTRSPLLRTASAHLPAARFAFAWGCTRANPG